MQRSVSFANNLYEILAGLKLGCFRRKAVLTDSGTSILADMTTHSCIIKCFEQVQKIDFVLQNLSEIFSFWHHLHIWEDNFSQVCLFSSLSLCVSVQGVAFELLKLRTEVRTCAF